MNILGISAYYHDSAACLVRDGEIIAAVQEERFSRIKHDSNFPTEAVKYCLKEGDLEPNQIDLVAFYDKPWIKFERLMETYLAFAPHGTRSFLMAMPLWLKKKLWMSELIKNELPGYKGQILYPEHHQSHAASTFFVSPFEQAAILTMDGVGEWATASWGIGLDNKIILQNELQFPHSLGLLYSAFTYYTGFRVNSGEYKMMGLAPYGEPKYVMTILDNLIDLKDDGSFRLDMSYFNYCSGLTMTSKKFHKLFKGPPRLPESEIRQKDMDIATSIQKVTEEIILRMARFVRRETGQKNLCLAGGVALNCVANGILLKENIFDNIWIQPAAGDAGGALGAALFGWYHALENKRTIDNSKRDYQNSSYLGPCWSTDEIETLCKSNNYPYARNSESETIDIVANALANGKVIGWFSGRMEFGPRALGARSILGDARSETMQSTINQKIKFRESFRPFAPSVLAEEANQYFDLPVESPYMLMTAQINKEYFCDISRKEQEQAGLEKLKVIRSKIPAVTHVDYSARVQTVSQKDNPKYHALISKFKEKTGCGLVVNTSFNQRGEPIVCSPEDAYNCFMQTGIDILVMENIILYKNDQPEHDSIDDKMQKQDKLIIE
ncbi:MAG: carbamoyltransferase [candidate division Zixibacteria bacterium]|nr:carbamoyltransferase [candidate division Zixibacteria bacterium]